MKNTLVICPSVKMVLDRRDLFLDIKMVEGLRLYAKHWTGPVKCLMRIGDRSDIAFGQTYKKSDLGFGIEVIGDDLLASRASFNDAAIVLASGDNHHDLDAVNVTKCPVVFIIEYTLATRLRISELELGRSFRSLKSATWTLLTEQKRRRAFGRAAGIQANGKPAFDAYRRLTPAPLLYFDSRVSERAVATISQVEAKAQICLSGAPLRLAFSGRLERMKGADHLIPIIQSLAKTGMRFTFDIFGSGNMADEMMADVRFAGLQDKVFFHGPVSFDEVLLPYLKTRVDLFVCCHRQADPSCTYIETLACGVPIVGYDNAAFEGVLELGDVGESSPMDDAEGLAKAILALDKDRVRLATMASNAIEVGRQHNFAATFELRVKHLQHLAI